MAKTNRKPVDKFERNQRLAQRPHRKEDDFRNSRDWLALVEDDQDDVAVEISSARTNAAY